MAIQYTPSLSLPYPEVTDTPLIASRDLRALAQKMDSEGAQTRGESTAALTAAQAAEALAAHALARAEAIEDPIYIGHGEEPPGDQRLRVNLGADVDPAPPVTASDITDATDVGRNVLTAPLAIDARNALDIWTGTRALLDEGTDTAERTWDAKELHEYVTDAVAAGGGAASWDDLTGKPSTFPPSVHTHDDRYYTRAEVDQAITDATAVAVIDARPWFINTHFWASATKLVTSGAAMQLTINGRATGGAISHGTVVATVPAEYWPRAEVYGTGQNFGSGVATAMTNGQITLPSVADGAYFKTTFSWVR